MNLGMDRRRLREVSGNSNGRHPPDGQSVSATAQIAPDAAPDELKMMIRVLHTEN
jgi:hypothetical protein